MGRVALSERALPTIVAESYVIHGSTICFSAPGLLLRAAARRGDIVCFEADSADAVPAEFWSVVIVGRLELLQPSLDALERPLLEPARDEVSLPMAIVTGRAGRAAGTVGDRS
jgi:nitroimidazol reductase NimA-like FMN-containing flavoprotein (pyridoxamine 5'-phosphate oxidase superfamily)